MEKCIIVAVADNGAIGRRNQLLWHLPGDMKYFKETTTGCPVIMGWMTYQSIGRPLPKRTNIVISIFPWPDAPEDVVVVKSLEEAYRAAEIAGQAGNDAAKCFVIGGAYTYAEAMESADVLYITHVHDAPEDADVFFPKIDPEVWREDARSPLEIDSETGITFEFVVYKRREAL